LARLQFNPCLFVSAGLWTFIYLRSLTLKVEKKDNKGRRRENVKGEREGKIKIKR
jgi:hypothetical protein